LPGCVTIPSPAALPSPTSAAAGESRYQEISHALVSLVEKLGFLSYRIQATDGTLFPSAARYRGCCHFNDSCASITADNVLQKVHDRVLYRIQDPAQIVLGKECRVRIECPTNVSWGAWELGCMGAGEPE
jgi:hypothetical protein